MSRSKRSRATTKRKTSTSTSSSTSQQSCEESLDSELLTQFEEEFARKLKKFDALLELKLFSLNQHKEWLKLKFLPSNENVPPAKDPSGPVNGKEIRSAPEVRKQSLRPRTRTLSSSKGTNYSEKTSKTLLSKTKKVMTASSSNILETPVGRTFNSQSCLSTPTVTPKVTLGTPVSVMRLPRQGEMTISMSGSPLLTAAALQAKGTNINVPMGNGRIISINGEGSLNPYDIPALDEETKKQLQALHDNLQSLMNMARR